MKANGNVDLGHIVRQANDVVSINAGLGVSPINTPKLLGSAVNAYYSFVN
jgi:hypothetical protein